MGPTVVLTTLPCKGDHWIHFGSLGFTTVSTGNPLHITWTLPQWTFTQVEPSKPLGALHQFIIKQYPHTKIILGRYLDLTHNHPLKKENIWHTAISHDTWEQVKTLLEQKVDCWEIMSNNYLLAQWSIWSVPRCAPYMIWHLSLAKTDSFYLLIWINEAKKLSSVRSACTQWILSLYGFGLIG